MGCVRWFSLPFAFAIFGITWAQIQTTTAIVGTVTDPTGAAVPGVRISIRNDDTGAERDALTNESGEYSIQTLKPGKYSITASKPGFKTVVVQGREVMVSIPAIVNINMEVGELAQQVTVSGEGQELINTTTGAVSTTISENLVENLPNQTRNFFDLVSLAPNTSPQYFGNGHLSFGSHSMRRVNAANSLESSGVFAAGSDSNASNVSVDGANVQMAVYNMAVYIQSPSTIQELRIETASANAEFGDGSNFINVITKSGANNYHGELFWQHRNDNFDANNFFTNLAGGRLPEYKRNKFGATLGGPIIRNKLHFFGNYEGSRLRQTSQGNAIVPTQQMREGDLSAYRPLLPGQVLGNTPVIYNPYDYDPQTGLRRPFPGNRIPKTLLDPATQKLLEYTALPNTGIVTDQDLQEFALDRLVAGASFDSVRFRECSGFTTRFRKGGFSWQEWWLKLENLMIYATYNIVSEKEYSEQQEVVCILSSLANLTPNRRPA